MARDSNRLTAVAVRKLTAPGRYGDGGGLWLQVTSTGSRSWLFRYMLRGRARQMGLGPVDLVSLSEARDAARDSRRLLLQGVDPIDARNADRQATMLQTARGASFRECAERYIEAHQAGWKNPKHRAQWSSTLETYAFPVLGGLPVSDIDTGLVLKVIEPIWSTKTETAARLRGRVELVLDWAAARGYRDGANPARWRGHLDKLLPAKSKVAPVQHHAALPFKDIPALVASLRERDGTSARCLEAVILTAVRTSEALEATWSEIDLAEASWTIPARRMKGGREHRVPLSPRVVDILSALPREGEFVFPGAKAGRPLSNMALLTVLRRMGREDLTTHGFRSTFRDWAAETTAFPNEVVEMALAHAITSDVEAAYRRGDLFPKRRKLMEAWGMYCTGRQ
ncbi:integrase arm-type DNA-binding domain-containing protein [Pseudoxanthobacter sp. M-2]|uniref:tyrosine-type recombinase/integrase n=1 Tax=Pseudoxanthobacter sp. M-2 TaxID=3078754 RepID=UPI0038FD1F1B